MTDLLDTALLIPCTLALVAGVRSLVGMRGDTPRLDGRALVLGCALLVGCALSWLVGGGTWRELLVRGVLAGFGAFSLASTYQWGVGQLPSLASKVCEDEPPEEPRP